MKLSPEKPNPDTWTHTRTHGNKNTEQKHWWLYRACLKRAKLYVWTHTQMNWWMDCAKPIWFLRCNEALKDPSYLYQMKQYINVGRCSNKYLVHWPNKFGNVCVVFHPNICCLHALWSFSEKCLTKNRYFRNKIITKQSTGHKIMYMFLYCDKFARILNLTAVYQSIDNSEFYKMHPKTSNMATMLKETMNQTNHAKPPTTLLIFVMFHWKPWTSVVKNTRLSYRSLGHPNNMVTPEYILKTLFAGI